jgi:hypothetical protein
VCESDRLPAGQQLSGAVHHVVQQGHIRVRFVQRLREVMVQQVVGQHADLLMPVVVEQHLERTEAQVRGRQPGKHRSRFDALAIYLVVAGRDTQRTRGRDAQSVHGLAAQVFPYGGTQHCTAVAVT